MVGRGMTFYLFTSSSKSNPLSLQTSASAFVNASVDITIFKVSNTRSAPICSISCYRTLLTSIGSYFLFSIVVKYCVPMVGRDVTLFYFLTADEFIVIKRDSWIIFTIVGDVAMI